MKFISNSLMVDGHAREMVEMGDTIELFLGSEMIREKYVFFKVEATMEGLTSLLLLNKFCIVSVIW